MQDVKTHTNDRAICKPCKRSMTMPEGYEIDWMQVVPRVRRIGTRGSTTELLQHDCGAYLRGQRVAGRFSDKIPCGARCVSATGPACECRCAGDNHGIG